MQLDEYSLNFIKALYSVFPEFQQYQVVKGYDDDEAYVLIEVPSPIDKENILWVSTYEEEITVGFDWYHTHFSYSETDEEDYKLAIDHIKEIMEEEIAIAVIKKDNQWVGSWVIDNEELPEINEDETIEVKSWNGTYFN